LEENLASYKHPQNGVPQLFAYNAFMIASNGTQSRVGTITADWERFFEWTRIEREDEPRRVSLEVMLRRGAERGARLRAGARRRATPGATAPPQSCTAWPTRRSRACRRRSG
jgi:hypothetical protein